MTKVGLYAIDKSTTLESNKSLCQMPGPLRPATNREKLSDSSIRTLQLRDPPLAFIHVASVTDPHHQDYEAGIFQAADHPIVPDPIPPEPCKSGC